MRCVRPAVCGVLLVVVVGCGGVSGKNVGLIGDSITDLSRGPLQQALGNENHIEIVGKFGARSDQVLPDVNVIAASQPAAAIINIGTNDALQQVPPAQFAANVQRILDELKEVPCRYLVAINDGITDKATGASRQPQAQALNQELDALGKKNGIDVIDWNHTIATNGGNGAVTFDAIHLSTKGVVLLAHTYKDALAKC
jgi:lysophospholipase L1-like esterase